MNIQSYENKLCYTNYLNIKVCSMSTSYVFSKNGCRYAGINYYSNNNYYNSHQNLNFSKLGVFC